jgi:hypothetical protein
MKNASLFGLHGVLHINMVLIRKWGKKERLILATMIKKTSLIFMRLLKR